MSGDCRYSLVVIGTSWGGLQALMGILAVLPRNFDVPIVIAQHRGPDNVRRMEQILQQQTSLPVCEAQHGDAIVPGAIYVAPADYHLLVEHQTLVMSTQAPVNFSRPSIDLLFESAADAYGDRLIALILTGANNDGSNGVLHVKRRGGMTIAQDPSTAERAEMPQAAIDTGAVNRVLGLDRIGPFLATVCGHHLGDGDYRSVQEGTG